MAAEGAEGGKARGLRRAAALEKRGDYENALADLREARISSVEKTLIDARVAHCEHLRDTRGSIM